jgi:hypothetical protein
MLGRRSKTIERGNHADSLKEGTICIQASTIYLAEDERSRRRSKTEREKCAEDL